MAVAVLYSLQFLGCSHSSCIFSHSPWHFLSFSLHMPKPKKAENPGKGKMSLNLRDLFPSYKGEGWGYNYQETDKAGAEATGEKLIAQPKEGL